MGLMNRPAARVVIGSGVAGPQRLVTSGQYLDRQALGVTWAVHWNMDGSAGSGAAAYSQSLTTPAGGSTKPIIGGAPAGQFIIEGSNDNVYYVDLGVTISGLYGVASSGVRLVNITGAMPDWQRLVYTNTSSSGVFDVYFGSRGAGGG